MQHWGIGPGEYECMRQPRSGDLAIHPLARVLPPSGIHRRAGRCRVCTRETLAPCAAAPLQRFYTDPLYTLRRYAAPVVPTRGIGVCLPVVHK